MSTSGAACPVDDVIIAPDGLAGTSSAAAARKALLSLSEALARDAASGPQRLVEVTMRATGADSAGITLEDADKPDELFRWIAVSGEYARYLHGTMPRHFSPCGEVLLRKRTLVMRNPVRHYPYIEQMHAPIRSALLVPFARRGRLVGTLWVLAHTDRKQFTTHDVQVVEGLRTFVSSLLDAGTPSHAVPPAGIRLSSTNPAP